MARILFQDVVPYDVPLSLDRLRGPADGEMTLPHSLHWGPIRHVDLSQPADQVMAYQAVVREGSTAQQEALLDRALLRQVWLELTLPDRCRHAWETAFPELRSRPAGRSV